MPDKLLTTADVAARLGVNTSRVRQLRIALARRGVVVGRRLGNTWVYVEADVERLRPGQPGRPKREG